VAELTQWRKLSDPVTLHANLVRGIPCKLPDNLILHLLGDDAQDSEAERKDLRDTISSMQEDIGELDGITRLLTAERDRLRDAIKAHINASNNDDTAGDTWGELLRVVGYDCE